MSDKPRFSMQWNRELITLLNATFVSQAVRCEFPTNSFLRFFGCVLWTFASTILSRSSWKGSSSAPADRKETDDFLGGFGRLRGIWSPLNVDRGAGVLLAMLFHTCQNDLWIRIRHARLAYWQCGQFIQFSNRFSFSPFPPPLFFFFFKSMTLFLHVRSDFSSLLNWCNTCFISMPISRWDEIDSGLTSIYVVIIILVIVIKKIHIIIIIYSLLLQWYFNIFDFLKHF